MSTRADAVDRILLHEAEQALANAHRIVVVDDESTALAELVARSSTPDEDHSVRAYTDSARTQRGLLALAADYRITIEDELDAELFGQADLVLLRLPKSLAALEEIAAAAARLAAPPVQLYAGGRVQHMSRGMNEVLERHFGAVRASLGQQKSRVLVAASPRHVEHGAEPRTQRHEDLGVVVCAYGGTFAGTNIDLGTRSMLDCFDRLPAHPGIVVDLGSGSGVLSALVAARRPGAQLIAVDDSRAAIRSTAATAAANGVAERVSTRHADRLDGLATASVDLVVCNPPFHRGTARDSGAAYAMFGEAARVLRPGGELWVVYNSHLPYRQALRRVVGRTAVLRQNPKFTVVRAVRRAGSGGRPALTSGAARTV